jgi:hypothetical protein
MRPIEPINFVGRAAPAALLFQAATMDEAVPRQDTLRYYQAASQPASRSPVALTLVTACCGHAWCQCGVLVLMEDRDRVESVSHLPRRSPDAVP